MKSSSDVAGNSTSFRNRLGRHVQSQDEAAENAGAFTLQRLDLLSLWLPDFEYVE